MNSDTSASITFKEQVEIPLDQITVSEENVRKTNQSKDIKKLQESIKKFGLIQPVVVLKDGSKYKLIVGQRRFLAFQGMGKTSIPALVIEPINRKLQQIVSFGENMHRKALPYTDTINLCRTLFNDYKYMEKSERINTIANDLGITTNTVSHYLAADLVPEDVKKLVDEGKISADLAYRITSAHYPDIDKITTIIGHVTRLTREEKKRVVDYGNKNPSASAEQILDYAKNPPLLIKITIHIDADVNVRLENLSAKQKISVSDVVTDAISRYLEEEED